MGFGHRSQDRLDTMCDAWFYLVLTASTVGCVALSGREGLMDERRISSLVPVLIIDITMIPVHGDYPHDLRYSFRRESILGWLASQP